MTHSTVPASDDVALAEIRDLAYQLGETPGRNKLMTEFGWGASKSTRLRNLFLDQTDQDRSAPYPGHADRTDEEEDQPTLDGAVWTEQTDSPPTPRQTADQTPGPSGDQAADRAGADRQAGPREDADGPTTPATDRPTTGPGRQSPARTGPVVRAQSAQVGHQTPRPRPVPVRASQDWESIRSTVDSAGQDFQATEGGGQAGPEYKTPYGLIIATLVISLSAFTAVWGGWVGLGRMVGFGPVNLLPGIGSGLTVDLAITLPLGIEAYAAAALWVAVGGLVHGRGRWFAGLSAGAALGLGAFGQATYHLLDVQGRTVAPDWVIVFVSVLPVIVLGAAGVLLHLVLEERKRRAKR